MHPTVHAKEHPDRAAYIMAATGETVTYRQLEDRSNQGAQLFRSLAVDRPVTKGKWTLKLQNEGQSEHEVVLSTWSNAL